MWRESSPAEECGGGGDFPATALMAPRDHAGPPRASKDVREVHWWGSLRQGTAVQQQRAQLCKGILPVLALQGGEAFWAYTSQGGSWSPLPGSQCKTRGLDFQKVGGLTLAENKTHVSCQDSSHLERFRPHCLVSWLFPSLCHFYQPPQQFFSIQKDIWFWSPHEIWSITLVNIIVPPNFSHFWPTQGWG